MPSDPIPPRPLATHRRSPDRRASPRAKRSVVSWLILAVVALVGLRFVLGLGTQLIRLLSGLIRSFVFVLTRMGRLGPAVAIAVLLVLAMSARYLLEARRRDR